MACSETKLFWRLRVGEQRTPYLLTAAVRQQCADCLAAVGAVHNNNNNNNNDIYTAHFSKRLKCA